MPAKKVMQGENDARSLLLALGMGDYNATLAIQYMFLAPAATDPAMPSIILMTRHLQAGLRAAGATVPLSGQIDDATAKALIKLVGPDWHQVTWFGLYQAVVQAKRLRTLKKRSGELQLGLVDLPDIPGGNLTWAAAGALAAWYFLFRKKH